MFKYSFNNNGRVLYASYYDRKVKVDLDNRIVYYYDRNKKVYVESGFRMRFNATIDEILKSLEVYLMSFIPDDRPYFYNQNKKSNSSGWKNFNREGLFLKNTGYGG